MVFFKTLHTLNSAGHCPLQADAQTTEAVKLDVKELKYGHDFISRAHRLSKKTATLLKQSLRLNVFTELKPAMLTCGDLPELGPHTASVDTSVGFCLDRRTSSCLYRSHTERSPQSSDRRHTRHTSWLNA